MSIFAENKPQSHHFYNFNSRLDRGKEREGERGSNFTKSCFHIKKSSKFLFNPEAIKLKLLV